MTERAGGPPEARGRYHASGVEAEFQPGSRGRVLRNPLGITRVRDMHLLETLALAQDKALESFDATHRFTAADICQLHTYWLDGIYAWAGLPALDFSPVLGRGKLRYIGAIHAAVGRDYAPMTEVFERVIARSRRVAGATAR